MRSDLEGVLDRLPTLAGRRRTVTPLAGGLTGRAWRVDTDAGRSVVRSAAGPVERQATEAAHAADAGPPVLDALDAERVLVVGWLDGRVLTGPDLHEPATLGRVADACRRLHAGPLLGVRRDPVAAARGYLVEARRHERALPPGYLDSAPAVERVAAALAVRPEPSVPCHHDLVPANLLDDGERVRFVDFEYAADGDPCAELGNLAGEAELDADLVEHLVGSYSDGPAPRRMARTRLYALITLYGWVAWAWTRDAARADAGPTEGHRDAARSGAGDDVDWPAWGAERYERARALLADPDLPALLDTAAG